MKFAVGQPIQPSHGKDIEKKNKKSVAWFYASVAKRVSTIDWWGIGALFSAHAKLMPEQLCPPSLIAYKSNFSLTSSLLISSLVQSLEPHAEAMTRLKRKAKP